MLWKLTWECEKDPCGELVGCFEGSKVEFPDGHGQRVLERVGKVEKTFQIVLQDEEKKCRKGDKDDEELDYKGGKSGETQLDRGSDLHERLLERQDPADLQGRREHRDAHHVAVKVVQPRNRVQPNVWIATSFPDLHSKREGQLKLSTHSVKKTQQLTSACRAMILSFNMM